jgi:hypothetical protein
MLTRQQKRRELRKIGEFISRNFAPTAPRHIIRLTGRVYGNAAYRQMHDLSHILYGDGPNGYQEHSAHPDIVSWIVREFKKLGEPIVQDAPTETGEEQPVGTDPV